MLGMKGLLTSRGIFENYLNTCMIEMKNASLLKPKTKFNAALIIEKLNSEEKLLPESGCCRKLLYEVASCGADLSDVYNSLSTEIHGAPWSGPSVRMYSSELRKESICILRFIASEMLLEVQEY